MINFKSTELLYKSESMQKLVALVERVSSSNVTVLVLGESGTGKELIARKIHEWSHRKFKPFISINCGALRDTLLESELFGHEKGSFTGAYTRKIGLLEVANGGTFLFDEVAELSPGIQAKLLRFLQEGTFYRVGGKTEIKVDVRIVSATNADLEMQVQKGRFREDLFYRINTITALVPPLRQRREDIEKLVYHFLNGQKKITSTAIDILNKYDWPGNVRELNNAVERLLVLVDGPIIAQEDLSENIRNPQNIVVDDYNPELTIHELEKRLILKSLTHFKGNKSQAANALGITIKTLYNKLHEYGEFENFMENQNVRSLK